VHVFWRVRGFSAAAVEGIQKRLAVELRTDPAATSCAQTTRLPGFVNYKRETPCAVTLEYLRPRTVLTPNDFPHGDIAGVGRERSDGGSRTLAMRIAVSQGTAVPAISATSGLGMSR
jgi:hypothetical protein